MSQIDASDFAALSAAVDQPDDVIIRTVQQQEGGFDGVLDRVFAGMVGSFNATKAAGKQAKVQYKISAPDGTHRFTMQVADGSCNVTRGLADRPDLTLHLGFLDFLRLITQKVNGMQLFTGGKLKISGNPFLAQDYQGWFDRPRA
jgi:alkyl sulfatase BDS1-like metallo-beta-lactamase superfamily hydrolase